MDIREHGYCTWNFALNIKLFSNRNKIKSDIVLEKCDYGFYIWDHSHENFRNSWVNFSN
jgi:hypothetical protein